MTTQEQEALLKDWHRLNRELMELPENEILELMELEKHGRARLRVMLRLFNRFNKLRAQREKVELAGIARG